MTKIEDMTLEQIEQAETIKNLKLAGGAEVRLIQGFIREFIDPSAQVCPHCSGQIRFAWTRVNNWYITNRVLIDKRKEALLSPASEEHACLECGTQLSDKRRKYCNSKCQRKFKAK